MSATPTRTDTAPIPLLKVVWIILVFSLALVPVIALQYSYNSRSAAYTWIGVLILLGTCGPLWLYTRHGKQAEHARLIGKGIRAGIALGMLWVLEISVNNFIAPPLPARDIIDNIFWGLIALSIFALAAGCAYRTGRFASGLEAGMWSGFVSGALACWMALTVIVFGMRFITSDPLNLAEWAARGTSASAPSMAAYFAYETFAGAFLHLVVLGIGMGALLGLLGAGLGKAIQIILRWLRPAGA